MSLFRRLNGVLFFLVLLGISQSASAADVQVAMNIAPQSGTVQDTFTLEITVRGEQAENLGAPSFENSSNFQITPAGTVSNQMLINGRASFGFTYTFQVVPDAGIHPGKYQLPQASLAVDGKPVALKPVEVTITDQPAKTPQSSGVDFVQSVDNAEPYVGEQVLHQVQIITAKKLYNASMSEANFSGFWHEAFNKNQETTRAFGNENFTVYLIKEALFPSAAGELTIPARTLTVDVPGTRQQNRDIDRYSGVWSGFFPFDFDTDYNLVRKRFTADPITVKAKPLPEPPVKGLTNIPVGKIKLASSIDKTTVKQGENLTLVIELYGDANLRGYDLPPLSEEEKRNFKVYTDKPQVEVFFEKDRIFFKKKFSLALVPQTAGTIPLPRFSIVTFDPAAGEYKTLEPPQHSITVTPDESARNLNIVSTLALPTSATEESKKKQVRVLGEDLLPQHVGALTFRAEGEMDESMFLAILLSLPLCSIVLRLYARRRRAHFSDPLRLVQKQAYSRAMQQFAALSAKATADGCSGSLFQELATVLTKYLGERFRILSSSLTAAEAAALVREETARSSLDSAVFDILSTCDRVRFGGGAEAETLATLRQMLDRAKELISQIEKQSKRK